MTRLYAAKKLLEHGPLTRREFVQITGWPDHAAAQVLYLLTQAGEVVPVTQTGTHRWLYRLA